jgi:site-specific recombinase XerD
MAKSKLGLTRTFAKARTQAQRATREMHKTGQIAGIGTARTYAEGLKGVHDWMRKNGGGSLQELSLKRARQYLTVRAQQVGQSTLDRDRQALQALLQQTGRLTADQRLAVIQAIRQQELKPRAYSPAQVRETRERMTPSNALGLEIAHAAGLRAHELLTLARPDEASPDHRPADSAKFAGQLDHSIYIVTGKGGLAREVSIPNHLTERLEAVRLDQPRMVRDRGILYQQRYRVGGGQALSQAFSSASKAALGFSNGIHGVRHSYAQQRHYETQLLLGDPARALAIVSQEIGHFRPEITTVYLR